MNNIGFGFIITRKHPEIFIGQPEITEETDNNANSEYSQDTRTWD